jgi:hypothetical protein
MGFNIINRIADAMDFEVHEAIWLPSDERIVW